MEMQYAEAANYMKILAMTSGTIKDVSGTFTNIPKR